eukprot:4343493-Amphidinium_carterae.1
MPPTSFNKAKASPPTFAKSSWFLLPLLYTQVYLHQACSVLGRARSYPGAIAMEADVSVRNSCTTLTNAGHNSAGEFVALT